MSDKLFRRSAGWPTIRWLILAVAVVASVPYWLPARVIALRTRIFASINGDDGIRLPGKDIPAAEFARIYGHPAADGRSRGAALSDLFWYWLSPGAEVHQEHLEPGPRYDEVARSTRRILTRLDKAEWTALVRRCTRRALDAHHAGRGRQDASRVRLRDLMMPIWAEVYFELVFGEVCPDEARELIVANAEDFIGALKCTRLRHMDIRARHTAYLRERLARHRPPASLPTLLSADEQAYYLQGTFFNTAVVQMSEAMAHLLLAVAANPAVQQRLAADPADDAYLDRVIDETLWHYPLFGVAHRITTAEIPRDNGVALPPGSVLLFDYLGYQQGGANHRFDPDRWLTPESRPPHHIPFGMAANRPCPARGIATLTMRVCAREVLSRYRLASTAEHTRSLPNRGPCLLIPRASTARALIPRVRMRVRDRWEAVPRGIAQLFLGSWMVWDARRAGLCRVYFAESANSVQVAR